METTIPLDAAINTIISLQKQVAHLETMNAQKDRINTLMESRCKMSEDHIEKLREYINDVRDRLYKAEKENEDLRNPKPKNTCYRCKETYIYTDSVFCDNCNFSFRQEKLDRDALTDSDEDN